MDSNTSRLLRKRGGNIFFEYFETYAYNCEACSITIFDNGISMIVDDPSSDSRLTKVVLKLNDDGKYYDEFEDYVNNLYARYSVPTGMELSESEFYSAIDYTVCDSSMNIHLFEEGENSKSLIEMQEVFCNFSGELKNVDLKKKSFEKSVYDLDSNLYTAILQNEYENISTKELLFAKRINDGFKIYRLMIIFDSAEMKY